MFDLRARRFVRDTDDPEDCRPVKRSDREMVFPGERQFNRARFREIGRRLEWDQVDPDILSQGRAGDLELRMLAPLHTTASWHHPGVVEHFAKASATVREKRENRWTRVSYSLLPFAPCVFSPRDVVLQERARLVDGGLEFYFQPRLTRDMSSLPRELVGARPKAGVSANSGGVPRSLKGVPVMSRAQGYPRAQAICM